MADLRFQDVFLAIIAGIGKGMLTKQSMEIASQRYVQDKPEDPSIKVLQELARTEGPLQQQALQGLGINMNVPAQATPIDSVDRLANISRGFSPEGTPYTNQPVRQFQQANIPPQQMQMPGSPMNRFGGVEERGGMPQPPPPMAPTPIRQGSQRTSTPEEREYAIMKEIQDTDLPAGVATKAYEKITGQQGRGYDMGFTEANNLYNDMYKSDPEQAKQFAENYSIANPQIKEKLFIKTEKPPTTTQGKRDTTLAQATMVKDSIKEIENDPYWSLRKKDPASKEYKRWKWLKGYQARILKGTDTDEDLEIFLEEKPLPEEENA